MPRGFGGKISSNKQRVAEAHANPASFAQLYLWPWGRANKPTLYKKQIQALEICRDAVATAMYGGADGGPGEKGRVAIMAANGAGKTARILPAIVIWLLWQFPLAKIKITSGAWTQVETQIWPNIEKFRSRFVDFPDTMYADKESPYNGCSYHWHWYETPEIAIQEFRNGQRTGREGFLRCITTNEPGRAEGDHEELPESPLIWIVDEAKTSAEWLKGVLIGRIRPTLLILMSSPGWETGWFHEAMRKDTSFQRIELWAEDCDHMSAEEIQRIKDDWKDFPALAESILGHAFMPMVEGAVINGMELDENLANPPARREEGERHAFVDFAWSGTRGETVLALRRGNVVKIEAAFHCDHLVASPKNPGPGICELLIGHFQRLGLNQCEISGDNGGGGKLVMDQLDAMGWSLTRVDNGATASQEAYANTGAEIWWEGGKAIRARKFFFDSMDQKTRGQLLNRKQKPDPKREKLAIESKEDMVERGVASPDRADAILGCMMPHGGYASGLLRLAIPVASEPPQKPAHQEVGMNSGSLSGEEEEPEDHVNRLLEQQQEKSEYQQLIEQEKLAGKN